MTPSLGPRRVAGDAEMVANVAALEGAGRVGPVAAAGAARRIILTREHPRGVEAGVEGFVVHPPRGGGVVVKGAGAGVVGHGARLAEPRIGTIGDGRRGDGLGAVVVGLRQQFARVAVVAIGGRERDRGIARERTRGELEQTGRQQQCRPQCQRSCASDPAGIAERMRWERRGEQAHLGVIPLWRWQSTENRSPADQARGGAARCS